MRSSTPTPAGCATVSWNTTTNRFNVNPLLDGPCSFDYTLTDTLQESTGTVTLNITSSAYAVTGTMSGLSSSRTVVLKNNAGDDLTVTGNGTFTFATPVLFGGTYDVTVGTQPVSQTCVVANPSGTANGPVLGLLVTCTTHTYALGGTIAGLAPGDSLELQDAVAGSLVRTSNGAFAFATQVPHDAAYAVTVLNQPVDKTCVVTNGSGTVSGAISDVVVSCTVKRYALGGTVSGLGTGERVVLQDGLGGTATVSSNGAFSFSASVSHGASYAVSLSMSPVGKTCTVSNGSGTMTGVVTNVSVSCALNRYSLGGTVAGLGSGKSVVLQNNGSDALTASADGAFSFLTPVEHGAAYAVTVLTQPTGQQCTVTGGSGVMTADVSDLSVTCLTVDAGMMVDAGSGEGFDAGTSEGSDAGTSEGSDAGTSGGSDAGTVAMADGGTSGGGEEPASCGCSGASTSGAWLLPALLAFINLRRRRR